MRSSHSKTQSTPVIYTCGKCASFYYEHGQLLEHLYWKHGTESQVCNKCQLKKWNFALHKCFTLPQLGITEGSAPQRSASKRAACNDNDTTYRKKYRITDANIVPKPQGDDVEFIPAASNDNDTTYRKKYRINDANIVPKSQAGGDVEIIPVCLGSNENYDDGDGTNYDAKSSVSNDSQYFSERDSEFCYCGKYIEGSHMIGCDNRNCELEWYHYECVGIKKAPKGDWYCPECKTSG